MISSNAKKGNGAKGFYRALIFISVLPEDKDKNQVTKMFDEGVILHN